MTAEEKAREYFDFYNEEIEAHKECPKCGRSYDELQFDLQYCKVCGWDADHKAEELFLMRVLDDGD